MWTSWNFESIQCFITAKREREKQKCKRKKCNENKKIYQADGMRSNLTSYRMNAFLYIIAVVVGRRVKLKSWNMIVNITLHLIKFSSYFFVREIAKRSGVTSPKTTSTFFLLYMKISRSISTIFSTFHKCYHGDYF